MLLGLCVALATVVILKVVTLLVDVLAVDWHVVETGLY